MSSAIPQLIWLRLAALLAWAVIGGIQLASVSVSTGRLIVALALYLVLGVCVYLNTRMHGPPRDTWAAWGLILAQYLCVVLLAGLLGGHMNYVFLVLIAGQLPWRLSNRGALAVAIAASLAVYLALDAGPDAPARWQQLLSYMCFQAFAFAVSQLALNERRAREALTAANAELEAARTLLAASVRQNERMRIARDLHDRVGHHLTALSLHLELASHLAAPPALEPIAQAQAISKELLHDVRAVVRELRVDSELDLRAALSRLLRGAPQLDTRLLIGADVDVRDSATAETLLRVVQEALTNTLRHARARRFEVALERAGGELLLRMRDDGRGLGNAAPGAGLHGMRERVEALGGQLRLDDGAGLCIQARLPLREHA